MKLSLWIPEGGKNLNTDKGTRLIQAIQSLDMLDISIVVYPESKHLTIDVYIGEEGCGNEYATIRIPYDFDTTKHQTPYYQEMIERLKLVEARELKVVEQGKTELYFTNKEDIDKAVFALCNACPENIGYYMLDIQDSTIVVGKCDGVTNSYNTLYFVNIETGDIIDKE